MAAEDVLKVDKVKGEPGQIVEFGEVLVVGGEAVTLGAPTVAGSHGRGRGAGTGPRRENHRVQEAPPQELAAQDRPSPGIHATAHHRGPDRRQEAEQEARAKPKPSPKAKPAEGAAEEAAPKSRKTAGKAEKPKAKAKAGGKRTEKRQKEVMRRSDAFVTNPV